MILNDLDELNLPAINLIITVAIITWWPLGNKKKRRPQAMVLLQPQARVFFWFRAVAVSHVRYIEISINWNRILVCSSVSLKLGPKKIHKSQPKNHLKNNKSSQIFWICEKEHLKKNHQTNHSVHNQVDPHPVGRPCPAPHRAMKEAVSNQIQLGRWCFGPTKMS